MFRICLGGSEQQHSQQNAVFEPVGNEESKREVLQVSTNTNTTAEPKNTTTLVLLEIVGAMGLAFVGQQEQQNQLKNPLAFQHDMNPYCVVRVAGKQVHRTSEIEHDTSPIWTLKTKSVCLLELELEQANNNHNQGVVTVELWQRHATSTKGGVVVSVLKGKVLGGRGSYSYYNMIGQVQLTYQQLVSGKGERVEFSMVEDQPAVHLALRFRPATRRDRMFFQQHEHVPAAHTHSTSSKQTDHYLWNTTTTSAGNNNAADVEFKNVVGKSLLKKNETIDPRKRHCGRIASF
jgi:hypothetical protein